jgi:hypothetical protein
MRFTAVLVPQIKGISDTRARIGGGGMRDEIIEQNEAPFRTVNGNLLKMTWNKSKISRRMAPQKVKNKNKENVPNSRSNSAGSTSK